MVWEGICETDKTLLIFVKRGVNINVELYREQILRRVVVPWSQKHFEKRQWIQEDWAPAHSARIIMNFRRQNFPKVGKRFKSNEFFCLGDSGERSILYKLCVH